MDDFSGYFLFFGWPVLSAIMFFVAIINDSSVGVEYAILVFLSWLLLMLLLIVPPLLSEKSPTSDAQKDKSGLNCPKCPFCNELLDCPKDTHHEAPIITCNFCKFVICDKCLYQGGECLDCDGGSSFRNKDTEGDSVTSDGGK